MKLKVNAYGLIGHTFSHCVRWWMSTLRYEAVFADETVDPLRNVGGPRIYLVWHEHLLAPLYLRPHANVSILISRHRDADVLEVIARASGFGCVRGSTNRGGATALRQLAERGRQQHLVITPDGPRGPRRRLATGPVFLASRLGLPIVPIAVAYDRCWQLPSWDRFAVPIPFTTGRVIVGSEISVAGNLDRAGLENHRSEIESEFLRWTEEAQAWASTRKTRPNAVRVFRQRPEEKASLGHLPYRRAA